jgi:DNA gyrase/topoisomerase IV subunit A
LITPRMIDEWIREVEERPASGPEIIRYIATRLSELDRMNEQLRDQNIQLRSGQRVEEYQRKIDSLEYQLELLKRQFAPETSPEKFTTNLLIYNSKGQILRVETDLSEIESGGNLGFFSDPSALSGIYPHLLLVEEQEELLLLYDTGRVKTLPLRDIPHVGTENLNWQIAYLQEPGVDEEMAAIVPIARMALFEFSIQASRRGFVKKVVETFFENHMRRGFIGSGVKQEADRTCSLVFANPEDLIVMVSREGILFCMETSQLPMTVEEAVRLSASDHILTSLNMGNIPSILFVTQNGKVIQREASWLEPASSFKTPGLAVISKSRRESGVHIRGVASGEENDWCAVLTEDGNLYAFRLGELFADGSIPYASAENGVLSFTVFHGKIAEKTQGED